MTVLCKCDHCGTTTTDYRKYFRVIVYSKSAATRKHAKSLGTKDICMKCFKKIFGDGYGSSKK